jgi:hypothetical protein
VAFYYNRHKAIGVYDPTLGRHVAVANAAVVEILRHVYRATRLLEELQAPPAPEAR